MVKISSGIEDNNIIFVDGGMDGSQRLGIMMALYIIHETGVSLQEENNLNFKDFYVVPVVNPDGYVNCYISPDVSSDSSISYQMYSIALNNPKT